MWIVFSQFLVKNIKHNKDLKDIIVSKCDVFRVFDSRTMN